MKVLALLLVLIGAGAVGALGAHHLMLLRAQRLDTTVRLENQPMQIRFLDTISAEALALGPLTLAPSGTVRAQIPFRQTLAVPIRDALAVQVDFEQAVPMSLNLDHTARIPVSTYADIEATTRADFAGIKSYRGLKVRARVPLEFELEVPIRIRYRGAAQIKLSGPALVRLDDALRVPVSEVLDARIGVSQRVSPSLATSLQLRMHPARDATAILVTDAELQCRASMQPQPETSR